MNGPGLRGGPRLSVSVPVALRFPDGDPAEGWGRLIDISVAGVRVETRCVLRVGQAVYLSFEPRKEMRLENLRSSVVRVSWEEGYYVAGLSFDESVDQAYLKEALLVLVNQAG